MNWGDWTSVQDIWVTTSPTMTPNTAVFENWDRLFVKRVLAVSGANYEPSRKVSWFRECVALAAAGADLLCAVILNLCTLQTTMRTAFLAACST